jgi:hypothetical protein
MSERKKTKIEKIKPKRMNLSDFIDKNHRLFTVMGVFGGLAALFTRLEKAEYLAFTSFAILLILNWELWRAFPKSEEASFGLTVFEMFLQFFLLMIGTYLYSTYLSEYVTYELLSRILPIISFGLFAGVAVLLFRKFRLYDYVRKIAPDGKSYTPIFRGLIALLIIIVVAWLAIALSNYVTELFFP